jgi:hypothetical protein
MPLKLSELTPETIKTWAKKEASKRGTQTRIAFDALRAFVNRCTDHLDYQGLAPIEAFSSRVKREILLRNKG